MSISNCHENDNYKYKTFVFGSQNLTAVKTKYQKKTGKIGENRGDGQKEEEQEVEEEEVEEGGRVGGGGRGGRGEDQIDNMK